jgi:hypothetical protein
VKLLDGHDNAKLGVSIRFGQEPIMCYDYNIVIQNLMEQGMSEGEAVEFFDYNIIGAWVGDDTPCFVVSEEEFFIDDYLDEVE